MNSATDILTISRPPRATGSNVRVRAEGPAVGAITASRRKEVRRIPTARRTTRTKTTTKRRKEKRKGRRTTTERESRRIVSTAAAAAAASS